MATKKSSADTAKSSTQSTPPPGFPNFDLNQWFGQFNMPGLDAQAVMEESRKDWEALQQAMQKAMEGWQSLAQRQNELMQSAMQQWQQDMTENIGRSAEENAQLFRERMEKGLADMQQLVETITQSQGEAAEILRQRFEENMKRLTGR